jgi:S1-C subfamily serine protease
MQETIKKTHQTLVVIALALTAVVGAVSGAIAALVVATTFQPLLSHLSPDDSQRAVESKIVELIEEESATIAVVEQITPAVVSVVVQKERGDIQDVSNGAIFNSFFFSEPLDEQSTSELVEVSSGTGFFVTEDGYVLTNRHVIDETDATYIIVTNEGKELAATLVDVDPFQDIAILDVDGEDYPTVQLGDSDEIRIGATVIAIGNTLSEFRNTVTKGVVSGINRRVTAGDSYNTEVIEAAIQTDAAINPGNSGGPLINLLGQVVGINTAVSFEGQAIGFAIPINEAKRAVADVREFGRIVRPWLGVRYVLVQAQEGQNIEYEIGARIIAGEQPGESAIVAGSPADLAGLKDGDIIIAVNSTNLSQDQALAELISEYRPGDSVELSVLRDGVMVKIMVELAEYGESE